MVSIPQDRSVFDTVGGDFPGTEYGERRLQLSSICVGQRPEKVALRFDLVDVRQVMMFIWGEDICGMILFERTEQF